jgi:hypothetical protein
LVPWCCFAIARFHRRGRAVGLLPSRILRCSTLVGLFAAPAARVGFDVNAAPALRYSEGMVAGMVRCPWPYRYRRHRLCPCLHADQPRSAPGAIQPPRRPLAASMRFRRLSVTLVLISVVIARRATSPSSGSLRPTGRSLRPMPTIWFPARAPTSAASVRTGRLSARQVSLFFAWNARLLV